MSPASILIIAGSILVLIGLIGGGITSKYGTIGTVAGWSRILCAGFGLLFVILGIVMQLYPQMRDKTPDQTAERAPDAKNFVTFYLNYITYEGLGSVDVVIDNKINVTVAGDANRINKSVAVSVPASGTHMYTAKGILHTSEAPIGVPSRHLQLAGEGAIDVVAGRVFFVRVNATTNTIALVQDESSP